VTKQKLGGLGSAGVRLLPRGPGDAIVNFSAGPYFVQAFGTSTVLIPLAHLVYSKLA
jgi:hypothetical protein